MATVADVLAKKGKTVASIAPDKTVLDAVLEMNRRRIGSIVVTDSGRLVGMFTERDVLRRVVAEAKSPRDTRVADVMTEKVACCRPETDLDELRALMAHQRIRHVPVCTDEGVVQGIISIGDLNAWDADGKEETIHWLNEYISGRA